MHGTTTTENGGVTCVKPHADISAYMTGVHLCIYRNYHMTIHSPESYRHDTYSQVYSRGNDKDVMKLQASRRNYFASHVSHAMKDPLHN